jgi:hypothetical protein
MVILNKFFNSVYKFFFLLGKNIVGTFHSKRSHNSECDVISFWQREINLDVAEALEIAFSLSIIKLYSDESFNAFFIKMI